jgi:hypothetical protein
MRERLQRSCRSLLIISFYRDPKIARSTWFPDSGLKTILLFPFASAASDCSTSVVRLWVLVNPLGGFSDLVGLYVQNDL